MYVTGQLIHIIIIVDWFHNKLLKKKVGVHCSASVLTLTISGKSSAVTSVTAEAVSLCGLVPSASVSAHSRLSFSNVGKKYLQRQNNTMNSVMRNVTNFVGKDFSLPNTTISHWPVGWRLTYFNFLAASLQWPVLWELWGTPHYMIYLQTKIPVKEKSPCSVGHLSRVAHMPKFKNSTSWKFCPPTHRIYMPSFIDVGPAVLEPWGLENIDIARMHRRTCDQFYKSSQQIWLKR